MKIHIDLSRGIFELEYEPMSRDKLFTVCCCITICIVVVAFFGIFK